MFKIAIVMFNNFYFHYNILRLEHKKLFHLYLM
jgi:hypothetical protein